MWVRVREGEKRKDSTISSYLKKSDNADDDNDDDDDDDYDGDDEDDNDDDDDDVHGIYDGSGSYEDNGSA